MNINTDKQYMFFVKEFNDGKAYSIGMSKRDKDGNYKNFYVPVRVTKNVSIENMTKAYIKSAWLEPYEDKEGKTRINIVINEIETIEQVIQESKSNRELLHEAITNEPDPYKDFGNEVELNNFDLPF